MSGLKNDRLQCWSMGHGGLNMGFCVRNYRRIYLCFFWEEKMTVQSFRPITRDVNDDLFSKIIRHNKTALLLALCFLMVGGCAGKFCKEEHPKADGEFYYDAEKHGYKCCSDFKSFSLSEVKYKIKADECNQEVWIIVIKRCYESLRERNEYIYYVNKKDLFLYSEADTYKPFRDKILEKQNIKK